MTPPPPCSGITKKGWVPTVPAFLLIQVDAVPLGKRYLQMYVMLSGIGPNQVGDKAPAAIQSDSGLAAHEVNTLR